VIIYAESSAVLAWLLGEPAGKEVHSRLRKAERVVTSALTAVECSRALSRARALERISAAEELAALRLLDMAESAWDVHDISDAVLVRARGAFPVEPVRTLDAIHLATAAQVAGVVGPIQVLSLGERVRANAVRLGMQVAPKA
jgi:uncharacterized protein with PIN domain